MTVSVIIPIYNLPKYLRQCVDSALGQNFDDFEVILVDDGSTDDCVAIVDEYAAADCRVKAIHKKNGGLSSARNAGLDVAEGDYVIFLDSDDWWNSKDCLRKLYDMAVNNEVDIIRGNYSRVDDDGNQINDWKTPTPSLEFQNCVMDSASFWQSVICGHYYVPLCLFKQSCIKDIRFDEELIFQEDIAFWSLLLTKPLRCVYTPLFFYNYRFRPNSMASLNNVAKLKSAISVVNKLYFFSSLCSTEVQTQLYIRKAVFLYKDMFCMELTREPLYLEIRGIVRLVNLKALNRNVQRWIRESGLQKRLKSFYMMSMLPPVIAIRTIRMKHNIARFLSK